MKYFGLDVFARRVVCATECGEVFVQPRGGPASPEWQRRCLVSTLKSPVDALPWTCRNEGR